MRRKNTVHIGRRIEPKELLLPLLPSPVYGLECGGDEKRARFVTMHESAMRGPGLRVPIPFEGRATSG